MVSLTDRRGSADDTGTAARPRRWRLWLAAAAGVLLLVLLAGFFALPPYAKARAERELSAALARPVSIDRIAFNPLSLKASVEGLAIGQRTGTGTLLAVRRIVANLSSASLWRRAPVLDAIVVDGLEAALAREADGRYNVQDLIDRIAAAPPGPPPEFSLNNIEVGDSRIVFDDRPAGTRHVVDQLRIGLPFLSSLPHDAQIHVVPRLEAVVDGRPFNLHGQTQPFAEPPAATLDVDIDALPLPKFVAYLPWPQSLRLESGDLTTRIKLRFVAGTGSARALELAGDVRVDRLAIATAAGLPLVAIPSASATIGRLDVVGRAIDVRTLEVVDPQVDVRRRRGGRFEWEELLAALASPGGGSAATPWQWRLGNTTLKGGVVRIEDASTTPLFRSTLTALAVTAEGLAASGEPAKVTAGFTTDLGAVVAAEGRLAPSPFAADVRVETRGLDIAKVFPYYATALNLEVRHGQLDAEARILLSPAADGTVALRVDGGKATISELRLQVPGEKQPLWRIATIGVAGVGVDGPKQQVVVGEVVVAGAQGRLRRERDGTLGFARLLRTTAAPSEPAAAGTMAWQVAIARSALQRASIDVEDLVPEVPFRTRVSELDLRVTGWSTARGQRAQFDGRARVGSGGRLAVRGPLAVNPLAGRLEVTLDAIDLAALQPYLDPLVAVVVTAGKAAAKGTLDIDAAPSSGPPRASWQGSARVTDFASLDRPTQSDLARWRSMALDGLAVTTAPLRVGIGAVSLDGFFARIIVHDDATLNLQRLLTAPQRAVPVGPAPATAPATAAAPPPSPPPPPPEPGTREELPIAIDRIALSDGTVQFSDFFVRPNYSVRLTDVGGTVSAMSPTTTGVVDVNARVERYAPVEIRGKLNPFARDLVLDVVAKARDIELSPLSPYAAKYAGYGIEKGKLAFDVEYAIEGRRLKAQNRLVLDQLTFGERVESPTATKLPVLLAVSLLKDINGVIDVNLPIEGSLDDPKFSLGGLIVQVIVNLLTKAVTAPFSLLTAALGGGEQMSFLEFGAGSTALDPPAVEKLTTLSKALANRPALKVDIVGRVDPASDAEGLRRLAVLRLLRVEKAKELAAAGKTPPAIDDIAVGADERGRLLAAAYRAAPIEERPRNVIGMLKDVPPAEMEAMLLRHAKADGEALRELGGRRAQVVKDWMAGSGGIAAERLFLVARPDSGPPKDGGSLRRVDFALR